MKKYILIGIPIILIHIISFLLFAYGTYTYHSYSERVELNKLSMSIHDKTLINRIESIKDKEKALSLAITKLKNDEKHNLSNIRYTLSVLSGAENHFRTITILAVISTMLSFMVIMGVGPMFKKVSNKAIKKDN